MRIIIHGEPDLADEGEDDEGRDGVGNESGDDEDHGGEDDQHAVQAEMVDFLGDAASDCGEQARRGDCLAEAEATGGEDNDRPKEVVEVFLVEDTGTEEQYHRYDRDHAHVAKDMLEVVASTPQADSR